MRLDGFRATVGNGNRFSRAMSHSERPIHYPDGIDPGHAEVRGFGGRGQRRWIALALLSLLMLAALLGLFGGGKIRRMVAEGPDVRLELSTSRVIRNGEFFEMRVRIIARRPVEKAVLAVPTSLWRDMTINTIIPAASEEKFEGNAFRFEYGALEPGETLDIKIDGQINPPLFLGTSGRVVVLDDARELAVIPLEITVLP
ncbi:hypothetical protein [Sphingomonas koreensis]|jgi:hypothetical protein|uniref:hypothetical protein n=2 Tax=Sphingomonas koreensis TaxID=93064 RepID=UPI000F7DBBBD|nr:hypothetical protein [Sphingomonas koreensis]MDC7808744.1 hypothetical protein [Sphingomonas koreensis]RSU98887.1 hypothetical protein CA256_02855 [Sphingomonas koreensis]